MVEVNRISRLGAVNAYLVREDDGLTLIDTMLGGSAGKIIDGTEASGAPIVRADARSGRPARGRPEREQLPLPLAQAAAEGR